MDFSIADLARRWHCARLASLPSGDSEEMAILAIAQQDAPAQETVLRNVFDNSRKLGLSLTRAVGQTWNHERIAGILTGMSIPCSAGTLTTDNGGVTLRRQPCSGATAFSCAYFREATDGLVMGLGDTARFARHQGYAPGAAECVDVYYDSQKTDNKWAAVPSSMAERFLPAQERLEKTGAELKLEGFADGTLYYSVKMKSGTACGSGLKLLLHSFFAAAKQYFPDLKLQDCAPRPVLGEMA